MARCKLCGGPTGVLGILGNLKHLVCRNCGAMFTREIRSKPWHKKKPK